MHGIPRIKANMRLRDQSTRSELPNFSKDSIPVPHILVVDDDEGVRAVLCRILEHEDYKVSAVESLAQALAALAEGSFDAYVLDYCLLDGTGLEFAREIRQQPNSAPIVLITGNYSDNIAAEARALDIFQIIGKPFTPKAICLTFKTAFEPV